MTACEICGATDTEIVEVQCAYGDRVFICRHGHFQGTAIDPWTSVPTELTGPLNLDALLYYPEGWVNRLKERLYAGGVAPWETYFTGRKEITE